MSKFIDKLDGLNKVAAPAMGFHTAGSGDKPLSMLVAVELSGKPEDELKEVASTGACAGILDPAGLSGAAIVKYLKTKVDMPVGLVLSGGKTGTGAKPEGSDIDFIVFDANLPVKSLAGNEPGSVGRVMRLDMTIDAGLMRAVNNLHPEIEAVIVDLRVPALTMEILMQCRRAADFSGQPVIALTGAALTTAELTALREAGVKCLVLPAGTGAADISSLIDEIRALPKPEKKKDKKGIAIVPRIGLSPAPKKDADDGGDDDGDSDE
jgi:CheY-like chemotaxis protein